jgi:hypothetical protein
MNDETIPCAISALDHHPQDPAQYTAVFSMQRNFQARLDIVQNMGYKVRIVFR